MSYVKKRKPGKKKATPEELVSQQDVLQKWMRRNSNLLIYGTGAVLFIAIISFGLMYVKGSRASQASASLSEAMAIYSSGMAVADDQGQAAVDPAVDQALAVFQETASQYDDLNQGRSAAVYAARILFEEERFEEAQETLENLATESPDFAERMNLGYLLAKIYEVLENYAQAAGEYSLILNRAEGNYRAVLMLDLARCYELQGDLDRARDYLERVAGDFPDTSYGIKAEKSLAVLGHRNA